MEEQKKIDFETPTKLPVVEPGKGLCLCDGGMIRFSDSVVVGPVRQNPSHERLFVIF